MGHSYNKNNKAKVKKSDSTITMATPSSEQLKQSGHRLVAENFLRLYEQEPFQPPEGSGTVRAEEPDLVGHQSINQSINQSPRRTLTFPPVIYIPFR
jgi:hypothetical protein